MASAPQFAACPQCNKANSVTAKTCSNCGQPMQGAKKG